MGKVILPILEENDKICSFTVEPGETSDVLPPVGIFGSIKIYSGPTDEKAFSSSSSDGIRSFCRGLLSYLEKSKDIKSHFASISRGDETTIFQIPAVKENDDLLYIYAKMLHTIKSGNETMHLNFDDMRLDDSVRKRYVTLAQDLQHISENDRISRLEDIRDYRSALNVAKFLKSLKETGLSEHSVKSIRNATSDLPIDLSGIDKFIELARCNSVVLQNYRGVLKFTYLDQEDKLTSSGYYKRHKGN